MYIKIQTNLYQKQMTALKFYVKLDQPHRNSLTITEITNIVTRSNIGNHLNLSSEVKT